MNNKFREISPMEITENTFSMIGHDWMLITAGNLQKYNTMTASWGGLGVLWGKKICFCVVRPHRYTYEFMEREGSFTLSFFDEQYRSALNFCGANSGRDVDKAAAAGITPMEDVTGRVHFEEARCVIECKKIYFQDLEPENFLDADIHKSYPNKDYHRMYVGEITRVLVKE